MTTYDEALAAYDDAMDRLHEIGKRSVRAFPNEPATVEMLVQSTQGIEDRIAGLQLAEVLMSAIGSKPAS